MVFNTIQKIIADIIGVEKSQDISMEFSFSDEKIMNEDDFFMMLEKLEEAFGIKLVDCAWRFETVKHLVDYIKRYCSIIIDDQL